MKKAVIILLILVVSVRVALAQETYIRLNQAGYRAIDTKLAIVFSDSRINESFVLKSTSEDQPVRFDAQPIHRKNWGRFAWYSEIDFSEIQQPGRYYFEGLKSKAVSDTFQISSEAYQMLPRHLLDFMSQQRCGYNPTLDIHCHQQDGRSVYGPVPDGTFVDARGGWHDAGDQLKYLITASYATAHMLTAYLLYPESFDDAKDASGENGKNGIPDVLDEARWGLDWILRLHYNDTTLIHQVADDRDHIGFKMPDQDSSDYGWGPDSYRVAYFATGKPQGLSEFKSEATGMANLAGRSAAALALGARIWEQEFEDTAFANTCKHAAISLYALGKKYKGYQQGNSYGAPYRYNEKTWEDDMEWGAAELYKLTGEKRYLSDAVKYAKLAAAVSWMPLDTAFHYYYYPFINMGHFSLHEVADQKTKQLLAGYYQKGIEACVNRASQNTFEIGVPFIWCSNNLVTGLITQIILYESMTGDTAYNDFLLKQRDWLFGRNPWGTSMFTGFPHDGDYPVDVHTSIWVKTAKMVPGGLVDGPVYGTIYRSLLGLILLNPDEYADVQNEYVVYHDDVGDYSTNEPTMDGTAGSLIMAGYFSHTK